MYTTKKTIHTPANWKVLMVDDEPEVHRTARMVLSDYTYKGIPLELIEAGSGEKAKEVIRKNPDTALILLDVVMESDEAGLRFIEYVRENLKNRIVQIVLKTGQAGRFPEREVVADYDINNFFSKTELTADKMTTMITSALRGYELASSLKKVNKKLQTELERKKIAEQELKESESQIRRLSQLQENIINSTDIWLHVKDSSGRIILWNKAAESISGYSKEEIKDNDAFWEALIPGAEERVKLFNVENLIFTSAEEPSDFETGIVDKSGLRKKLNWHLRPLKDEKGKIMGISCLGVDITEKKILEKKFLHSQKMEAVGRLAGGVAHDFNNTLTVIRGYCELLQLKTKNDQGLYKNIVQIDKAAEKAEMLTRQLLSFSRHQLVKTECFDINNLVLRMKNMLSRLLKENISIYLDIHKEKLFVKTNPDKIEQAVMNMVVNAVDALPDGGKITIKTGKTEINGSPGVFLSVSDNGHGISKEIQPHVFDPFFTTKSRDKGTGLGLSTVYGIMKQCKGSVSLKSEQRKGTEIILSFPAVNDNSEDIDRDLTCSSNRKEKKLRNIALAEQDSSVRQTLGEMLTNQGYNVFQISSKEDLNDLDCSFIDLLITDFIMPDINGPDIFEKISSYNSDLKAVYISGSGVDIPSKSDIHIFLEKPFTAAALFDAVKELFGSC
ncbi:MAG: ATP-binding protein [Thermodesulfobacteriota bacterium]